MSIIYKPRFIENDKSLSIFYNLLYNVPWIDGIKNKHKEITRKAYNPELDEYPFLTDLITNTLESISNKNYILLGIYLNLYENGEMYTPTHSHKDTEQLIISLGETRTLKINSRNYNLSNGDVILFGSQPHSVPKSDTEKSRISIATFMKTF